MNKIGIDAAEAYIAAKERKANFFAECKEIESEFKEEALSAKSSLEMFLETQPLGAKLSDGRVVEKITKNSSVVVTEERLRAAFVSADASVDKNICDAVIDALKKECTTTKHAVKLTTKPQFDRDLIQAPAAIERLCKQLGDAEKGLLQLRKHKRNGNKKSKSVMDPLQKDVEEAYAAMLGKESLPPSKRPRNEKEEKTEMPTVLISKPPEITLPGANENTPLPTLPEEPKAEKNTKKLSLCSETVDGEIKVRLCETHSKGKFPTLKQFIPKLKNLLNNKTHLDQETVEQAVDMLKKIRSSTAETRTKLKIEKSK